MFRPRTIGCGLLEPRQLSFVGTLKLLLVLDLREGSIKRHLLIAYPFSKRTPVVEDGTGFV
jgi:hypothetical protein